MVGGSLGREPLFFVNTLRIFASTKSSSAGAQLVPVNAKAQTALIFSGLFFFAYVLSGKGRKRNERSE